MNLKKHLEQFRNKHIIIIGDLMLDKYIFGSVDRISPEAPVPIIDVKSEKYVPGGAANAAANVATLGGSAYLYGLVGNDAAKSILLGVVSEKGINTSGVITDGTKPTIQKIRVLGPNQQLLRIDYEDRADCDASNQQKIMEKIQEQEHIDAIIVSDYAKGVVTPSFMKALHELSSKKSIPLIIDPKPSHKNLYKNATLITPNKKEAEELSGMSIESESDIESAGKKISTDLNCKVLLTLGEKGMALFEGSKKPIVISTDAKEVYDVSGAGDTVIATLSLAIASGANLHDAAQLANYAAGIKVGKVGTAPVLHSELLARIEQA